MARPGVSRDRHLPFAKLWLCPVHPGHSAAFSSPKRRHGDSGRGMAGRHTTAGCCEWPTGPAGQVRPQGAPVIGRVLATALGSREAQEQLLALFSCVLRFGTKCTLGWEAQPTWILQLLTAVLLYITLKLIRRQIIFPATLATISHCHYQEHFCNQDFVFHCHLLGSV